MSAEQIVIDLCAGVTELVSFGKLTQLARCTPRTLAEICKTCEAKPVVTLDGILFFDRPTAEGLLRAVRAADELKAKAETN